MEGFRRLVLGALHDRWGGAGGVFGGRLGCFLAGRRRARGQAVRPVEIEGLLGLQMRALDARGRKGFALVRVGGRRQLVRARQLCRLVRAVDAVLAEGSWWRQLRRPGQQRPTAVVLRLRARLRVADRWRQLRDAGETGATPRPLHLPGVVVAALQPTDRLGSRRVQIVVVCLSRGEAVGVRRLGPRVAKEVGWAGDCESGYYARGGGRRASGRAGCAMRSAGRKGADSPSCTNASAGRLYH